MEKFLRPGGRVHLMGIGGVSMAPLAEVLLGAGLTVTGSDMQESDAVRRLVSLGIPVHIGHRGENLGDTQAVIRTAAVHDDNPEVQAARARGIPVFERAQAWGAIMRRYRDAICVAGTHGKTTVTSMCTCIALAANADPTVMIGGVLPALGCGYRVGAGDAIILESCEYCDSFLAFYPTVAVVLNIEEDHLDYFKGGLPQIKASFRKFAAAVPPDRGVVVADGDDPNTVDALAGLDRRLVTFGLDQGDVHAAHLTWTAGYPTFDVVSGGETLCAVSLKVPGLHNVGNALAAAAAAVTMGWPAAAIREGLESFTGAGRRFERLGKVNGADLFDDYAHHPREITALLQTAKTLGYDRVVCAFQPHTYTRTKSLFGEFVKALSLADLAVLTDIFAARETDDLGVSSAQLAQAVPGALYCPTLPDLAAKLKELAKPGDLILLVGAGDIVSVGRMLAQSGQDGENS